MKVLLTTGRVAMACALVLGAVSAAGAQTADTFAPNANSYIYAVAVQPDGKVLVGGDFWMFGCAPGCGPSSVARNYIARLNADGSVDATFNPGANGPVRGIVIQPDGRIVAFGNFSAVGGGTGTANAIGRIARFNADGTVDTAFNAGNHLNLNLPPLAIALQPDGKIVMAGQFTVAQGQTHWFITRLNTDGTVDTGFAGSAWSHVYTVALQPDGKILIGGVFSSLGGPNADQFVRSHIGRLNADGTVDPSFNPGANGNVETIALQADGKILVTGNFTGIGGGTGTTSRNKIATTQPGRHRGCRVRSGRQRTRSRRSPCRRTAGSSSEEISDFLAAADWHRRSEPHRAAQCRRIDRHTFDPGTTECDLWPGHPAGRQGVGRRQFTSRRRSPA